MAGRGGDPASATAVFRRRWPLIVLAGVTGGVLGAAYAQASPPQPSSTALVLLSSSGGASTDTPLDIATQVRVVLSSPVLEQAGRAVTPALSAEQVRSRVEASAATSQLIEIDAVSRRAPDAQALAQGLAAAYVKSVRDNARSITSETVGDLTTRADDLKKHVTALQTQLDETGQRRQRERPDSPAGLRDAQLFAQLTREQADVALALDKVQTDLAASATPAGAQEQATIAQPATPALGPSISTGMVTWIGLGAGLGILLVATLLVAKARRDPRLRFRDDLADAVGASVLADVRSRPQRSVAAWWALLETYQASAVDGWAFRQILRSLSPVPAPGSGGRGRRHGSRIDHPRSVAVICVSGDAHALAVGPQIATFTASLGITTRLLVGTGHDMAGSLRAACSTERASRLRPGLVAEAWFREPDQSSSTPVGPPQAASGSTNCLQVSTRARLTSISGVATMRGMMLGTSKRRPPKMTGETTSQHARRKHPQRSTASPRGTRAPMPMTRTGTGEPAASRRRWPHTR